MPSIDSVQIDTSALLMESESAARRCWLNDAGEPLSLHFFDKPPDLPAPPDEVEILTTWYRRMALQGGLGLVELAAVRVDQLPSIRLVLKGILDGASGRGRTYLGSLTLPFRDFSYVVKVEYREWGITGAREAMVLAQRADLEDWLEGWIVDPSDPAPPDLARNLSEEPQYDSLVPNHPLSRVRRSLDALQASLTIVAEVKALPRFVSSGTRKQWWQIWR
jgi:hypothetical protein